ncbi:hypothetical protein C8R45DRAFT_1034848 [Mycena sanguinolenta]|nr:hypothetical protein C8R45DRAFT_1034848 [Mycena sanguinolenta]
MAMAHSDSQESLQFSCPKCMHRFGVSDVDPTPSLVSSDIVQTNDPPLDSQIPVLQDFISRGRARMAALETKIALLNSSLGKLVQQKDELAAEIRMHENSLSPLRRMPTEILSHVFAFTLPPHEPDAEPAPWAVSAVCARWKVIAVSQPCFWTTIQYDGDLDGANALKYQTQLSRSGQLPLNVKFRASYWEDLTPEDHQILDLICKHTGRWETVSFAGPEGLHEPLRSAIQGPFPQLRKLVIDIPLYHDSDDEPWELHDAPLLQTVFFNRDLSECPLSIVLPWPQLLRFGGSNTWQGHLSVLRRASNLVDCSLEMYIQDRSESLADHSLILPHLRRLSLSNSNFLDCLQTPALEELYCNFDTPPPVISFLHQQTCKLQKLVLFGIEDIEDIDRDPADLTRVVQAVPTITRLGVFFDLPIEFVRDFRSRSSTLAPALEHFSSFLEVKRGAGAERQGEFMDAIESRWRGSSLKSVKVYGLNLPVVSDRLDLLRTEGMECAVFEDFHPQILRNLDEIPPEHVISTYP